MAWALCPGYQHSGKEVVCVRWQDRVMWFELGGSRLVQCPLSITQALAERFQTRYKMSQVLSFAACLHTKHYTSIIHQSQSNANGAHYQSMARTRPWTDLMLRLWKWEKIWECPGLSNVEFLVCPPSISPLPGFECLNWEVIDAGCQVALEKCHCNASCRWVEWPWHPCRCLSQRPQPSHSPDASVSLNSPTQTLPSKTSQSESQ